jgi:hypothetical protein
VVVVHSLLLEGARAMADGRNDESLTALHHRRQV